MNSILKILTDYPCQVFCDFQLIGDAVPNSIFRVELRKGTYIFEFKHNNKTLLTQEHIIYSNEEEQLLKISLIPIVTKINREERDDEIANRLVEIEWHSSCLIDKESEKKIPIKYNIAGGSFDKCGLLSVNVGGEFKDDYGGWSWWYEGGKFGCINKNGDLQIPLLYDSPVFFDNEKVAIGRIATEIHFINKWGKDVFENKYDRVSHYTGDVCIIGIKDKYGLMNSSGVEITPIIYDKISLIEKNRNVYAYLSLNKKEGICDSEGKIIIPIKYDTVNFLPSCNISVCLEGKYGVIDVDGNMIVPIEYEILNNSIDRPITKRNKKYGVIDKDAYHAPDMDNFKELVPIVYDAVYNENGKERSDEEMYGIAGDSTYFVKKERGLLHCFVYKEKELKQYEKGWVLETGEEMHVAVKSIYNAEIKDEFICKSFCKIDWENILILDDRYYLGQYFKDIKTDHGYDKIETITHDEFISYNYYALKKGNQWNIVEKKYPYKCILADIEGEGRFSTGTTEHGNYLIIHNHSCKLYLIHSSVTVLVGEYEYVCHHIFRDSNKKYFKGFFSLQLKGKWAIATDDFSYVSPFVYEDSAIGKYNIDNIEIRNAVCHGILTSFFQYKTYGEKKILFIDTETTGLPLTQNAPYTDLKNWPYLVQIGIILECGDFREQFSYSGLSTLNILVAPTDYTIPIASTMIHGIFHNQAVEYGVERNTLLSYLDQLLYNVDIIIGHNVEFDLKVIKSEIYRVKEAKNLFHKKNHRIIDTMKLGTEICKIPMQNKDEYKWPTLDELYNVLFHKKIAKRHNAMSDVEATYECVVELWLNGYIK